MYGFRWLSDYGFSPIKNDPDVIGQNKYDFRNQHEKLPQKHMLIV